MAELLDCRTSRTSTSKATKESFRKLLHTKYEYVEKKDNTIVSNCHESDIFIIIKETRSAGNEQLVMRDRITNF